MHSFRTFLLPLAVVIALAIPARPHPYIPHVPASTIPGHDARSPKSTTTEDNTMGSCNVDGQQCCQALVPQSSTAGAALTSMLGIPLDLLSNLEASIGLQCAPLVGGGQCEGTAVCCSGQDEYNGAVNVGCVPLGL